MVSKVKKPNYPAVKGKTYDCWSDFKTAFRKCMETSYVLDKTLQGKSLKSRTAAKMIAFNLDLTIKEVKIGTDLMRVVYYRHPTDHIYQELRLSTIEELVSSIGETWDCDYDISRLSLNVFKILRADPDESWKIHKYNPAKKHYLYLDNGIYNLINKDFYLKGSDKFNTIVTTYQFFSKLPFDYLEESQNQTKLDLFKTFVNSLASNDKKLKQLIHEIIYAVIDGNGRRRYILMSGQAGSGKSTLAKILSIIAGNENVAKLNLTDFGDSNFINGLGMNTRLVIGDDLRKNAKLVGNALSNYKTLVSGQSLSVTVKYEPNRIIECHGVFLQLMNDDPTFYEGGEAMYDRTLLVRITGKNHRQAVDEAEKEIAKRLDSYTGLLDNEIDNDFFNEIISYILRNVNDFDKFTVPDGSEELTKNMVDEGSWSHQFIEDAKDKGLFSFNTLVQNDLVSMVQTFLKETNPSMKIPSARMMLKELDPLLEQNNFIKATGRMRSVPLIDYNYNIVNKYMYNIPPKKTQRHVVYHNITPVVDDDYIEKVKTRLNDGDIDLNNPTMEEIIAIEYLISKNDATAISAKELFN